MLALAGMGHWHDVQLQFVKLIKSTSSSPRVWALGYPLAQEYLRALTALYLLSTVQPTGYFAGDSNVLHRSFIHIVQYSDEWMAHHALGNDGCLRSFDTGFMVAA
jgi:hypothetical protein